MPSRNVIKEFAADQYYHVYNRGVEKRVIFLDDQDYTVFIGLLKKYLTSRPKGLNGTDHVAQEGKKHWHKFDDLSGEVELLSYCLMPNHFHLLFYQISPDGITKLMRRVTTGYSMYFNYRYLRVGTLFQGRYRASQINADAYLHHISRYIHMNPDDYMSWPYSSLAYVLGAKKTPLWLKPGKVLELFNHDVDTYMQFLNDYQESKAELKMLKWQLANDPDS